MKLSGSFETDQPSGKSSTTRLPAKNQNLINSESSQLASASYMLGTNIPTLTGPENHSIWESRMKAYFMGIGIISLLHPKERNPTTAGHANYETYNNRGVASIYAKISDDCVEFIQDCFDTATIMAKFRSQFADKGWGAESRAYHNLHRIKFVDCVDMPDYVSKLRSAHHRLANMGFVISNKVLVYILIMGLGPEFASWASAVKNSSRAASKPPSFDTLTAQLLAENTYRSTTEAAFVAARNRITQKTAKESNSPKNTCEHCGWIHADDSCYLKCPEKARLSWKQEGLHFICMPSP